MVQIGMLTIVPEIQLINKWNRDLIQRQFRQMSKLID